MSLSVLDHPNPYTVENLPVAYAYIGRLEMDFTTNMGQLRVDVYTDAAAALADKQPVERPVIALGDFMGTAEDGTPIRTATLAELMADPEFAAAFSVIRAKLYSDVVRRHPAFAGATDVD